MTKLERAIARLSELDQESLLALTDIAEERVRQIEQEGWSPEHDDAHGDGELAAAGACYAVAPHTHSNKRDFSEIFRHRKLSRRIEETRVWPWHQKWWKPGSLHRNRIRGGALILAELARHYRKASAAVRSGQ